MTGEFSSSNGKDNNIIIAVNRFWLSEEENKGDNLLLTVDTSCISMKINPCSPCKE